jgi:hypothetical protein
MLVGFTQTLYTATSAIRQDVGGPHLGPATRRPVPGTADSGPATGALRKEVIQLCNLLR